MSTKHVISVKWILIGAVITIALNHLIQLVVADPIQTSLITSLGAVGVFVFIGIVAFFSFFVGGAIIGFFSPGETIVEPAIAAAVAVMINAASSFRAVNGTSFTTGNWAVGSAISLVIGLAMGLGGAWLGEKFQGGTPEKDAEHEGEKPTP
jgi:hypothetical protein